MAMHRVRVRVRRRQPPLWDAVLLVILVAMLIPIALALATSATIGVITLILGG